MRISSLAAQDPQETGMAVLSLLHMAPNIFTTFIHSTFSWENADAVYMYKKANNP